MVCPRFREILGSFLGPKTALRLIMNFIGLLKIKVLLKGDDVIQNLWLGDAKISQLKRNR